MATPGFQDARRRVLVSGDRRPAVHQPEHRQVPRAVNLPPSGCPQPDGGGSRSGQSVVTFRSPLWRVSCQPALAPGPRDGLGSGCSVRGVPTTARSKLAFLSIGEPVRRSRKARTGGLAATPPAPTGKRATREMATETARKAAASGETAPPT